MTRTDVTRFAVTAMADGSLEMKQRIGDQWPASSTPDEAVESRR